MKSWSKIPGRCFKSWESGTARNALNQPRWNCLANTCLLYMCLISTGIKPSISNVGCSATMFWKQNEISLVVHRLVYGLENSYICIDYEYFHFFVCLTIDSFTKSSVAVRTFWSASVIAMLIAENTSLKSGKIFSLATVMKCEKRLGWEYDCICTKIYPRIDMHFLFKYNNLPFVTLYRDSHA